MPINSQGIIDVVVQLAEQQNLKVTLTESAKGACIAGGGALVGGVLGGPAGLAIGGVLGSLCAAWHGSGKYKSVVTIIMIDMTPVQRNQLAASIQRSVQDIQIEDVVMFASLVLGGNPSVQKMVLLELGKFLKNEMGLAIQ